MLFKFQVIVTLWGSVAENFKGELLSVVAIRKGHVSTYQEDYSVNIYSDSLFWVRTNICLFEQYFSHKYTFFTYDFNFRFNQNYKMHMT